jgi:Arylsulfotransferase (ASST)
MLSALAGQPPRAMLIQLIIIANFFSTAAANWQYKSRPDLSPPTLNITVSSASEISPGYLFVAPYSGVSWDSPLAHGPLQPGPYIFTSTGELVWSGFGYVSGFITNFQAAKWKGEDVLFAFESSRNFRHGHGHGHAKILNRNYETIREVRGGNSALLDVHEFHILDEKTALVQSYKPIPFDLKSYGAGPKSQWIVEAIFQGIANLSGLKSKILMRISRARY